MKSTSLTLGIASVLVAVGFAPEVHAACMPPKDFKLAYSDEGDHWLIFPPHSNSTIGGGVLKTRFWEPGNRAAVNEGDGCPQEAYMFQLDPDHITIFGASGGNVLGSMCDNLGCPTDALIMLVQTLSEDGMQAYYAVGKVAEDVGEFRYNRGGTDWQLTEIPRPRVQSSSRTTTSQMINVCIDPPMGAHGEADGFTRNSIVTGYQIVRAEGASDPGRDPVRWTNVGSPVPVNEDTCSSVAIQSAFCVPDDDVFFAVRPIFDDGEFMADYVGASTRVECSPTLAEPRFGTIERTKTGRGVPRMNPR